MQDTVSSLVTDFWTGLSITIDKIEIVVGNEDVNIHIQTPDSALIIGMHGRSLESFNHILGRMIESVTGSFVHVHLEVNDYMKTKDERLFKLLDTKISFVMSTGKSLRIPNLNSYDRKKAHNYVSEKKIEKLTTHSEGVGEERSLVLEYTGELRLTSTPIIHSVTPSAMSVDDLSEDGIGI